MDFSRALVIALVGVLAAAPSVAAQVRLVTISQPVRVVGEPASASIVVSHVSGIVGVAPAIVVPTSSKEEVSVVGRVALPVAVEQISSLAIVSSKTGEVGSGVRQISALSAEPMLLLDKASLEARLSEQRDNLKKWEAQARTQEVSLNRLQDDADVIANVSKIVDVEDELDSARADSQRLKTSLGLASRRLESLKTQPVPPNFKLREAELSEQLNDLSTALKTTEASALRRVAAASAELQQKLALIEATKGKQIDVLKAELARVRREREQLQRDLRGSGR